MLKAMKQTAFVVAVGAAAFSFAAPASAAMQPDTNGTVTVTGTGGGTVVLNMGGNSDGVNLSAEQSGAGGFTLDFGSANLTGHLTLSNFAVRYQALHVGSVSGTGQLVNPVPEPGTWALMLLGIGAIGASMRRRRRVSTLLQMA